MADQDALEVYMDNGQLRIFKDPMVGEFIQEYIYYRFDDIEGGLFIEIGGYNVSRRGAVDPKTKIDLADPKRYISIALISPEDLKKVHHAKYKGELVLVRIKEKLTCIIPLVQVGRDILKDSIDPSESFEDYLMRTYFKYFELNQDSVSNKEKIIDQFANLVCIDKDTINLLIDEKNQEELKNNELNEIEANL